MYSEARKLHLIEEMLKEKSEAILIKLENVLKSERAKEKNIAGKKPSDYVGCLSKEEGEQLLKHIAESRNEWERDF